MKRTFPNPKVTLLSIFSLFFFNFSSYSQSESTATDEIENNYYLQNVRPYFDNGTINSEEIGFPITGQSLCLAYLLKKDKSGAIKYLRTFTVESPKSKLWMYNILISGQDVYLAATMSGRFTTYTKSGDSLTVLETKDTYEGMPLVLKINPDGVTDKIELIENNNLNYRVLSFKFDEKNNLLLETETRDSGSDDFPSGRQVYKISTDFEILNKSKFDPTW